MAINPKTKTLVLACLAVVFDGVSQIPSEEKDEAIELFKTELEKYQPGEVVPISNLIYDLKQAVIAGEDLAGKEELIAPTEKAFDLAESIAEGKSFFASLVASLFHKHAAIVASATPPSTPVEGDAAQA